jgi:hypothetical protein
MFDGRWSNRCARRKTKEEQTMTSINEESRSRFDEFQATMAPTVAVLRGLCEAINTVAPRHGRLPSHDSKAMTELAAEAKDYSTGWWQRPVADTHSQGGMALFAATDFAMTFASCMSANPVPVYGHLVVARSCLEASVVAQWLNEPAIAPDERVRRGLCEQIYSALELKRLNSEDAQVMSDRVDSWENEASHWGWAVSHARGKPAVDSTRRPSVPSAIDLLLMGQQRENPRLGQAQWSLLSAVSHVTWYGLAQSLAVASTETSFGPPLVDIGTSSSSVRAQAVCVLKSVRAAASSRFELMGWADAEWCDAANRSEAHEVQLVRSNSAT